MRPPIAKRGGRQGLQGHVGQELPGTNIQKSVRQRVTRTSWLPWPLLEELGLGSAGFLILCWSLLVVVFRKERAKNELWSLFSVHFVNIILLDVDDVR